MAWFKERKGIIGLLVVMAATVALCSCGGSEGGLNDTGGGIVLSAEPESIPADGASSTQITATVHDTSDNAVPLGTVVTFKTTLGRFSNEKQEYSVTTGNAQGIVAVSLIASKTEGYADVTCTAAGASAYLRIRIGSASGQTDDISLAVEPASIVADGISTATITATLTDINGNPVDEGTSVQFVTTMGVFSNNSNSISLQVLNRSGIVSVILRSSTTPGTAVVRCSSNGITREKNVTFTELEEPAPEEPAPEEPAEEEPVTTSLNEVAGGQAIAAITIVKAGAPVQTGSTMALPLQFTLTENGIAVPHKVVSLLVKAMDHPQAGVYLTTTEAVTGMDGTLTSTLVYPASLSGNDEVVITFEINKGNAGYATGKGYLELP